MSAVHSLLCRHFLSHIDCSPPPLTHVHPIHVSACSAPAAPHYPLPPPPLTLFPLPPPPFPLALGYCLSLSLWTCVCLSVVFLQGQVCGYQQ